MMSISSICKYTNVALYRRCIDTVFHSIHHTRLSRKVDKERGSPGCNSYLVAPLPCPKLFMRTRICLTVISILHLPIGQSLPAKRFLNEIESNNLNSTVFVKKITII